MITPDFNRDLIRLPMKLRLLYHFIRATPLAVKRGRRAVSALWSFLVGNTFFKQRRGTSVPSRNAAQLAFGAVSNRCSIFARDGVLHEPVEAATVRLGGWRRHPAEAAAVCNCERSETMTLGRAHGFRKCRTRLWLPFVLGVMWLPACSGARAYAQSLQLSAPSAAPGEWVAIEIVIKPPLGKDILALQWEMEIPANQLDLETERAMRAVIAVQDAGKSVTCAMPRESPEAHILRCILAGGQKPIPDGKITTLSLKILENPESGPTRVRLQNAVAVGRDQERVPFGPAETTVTVQAR